MGMVGDRGQAIPREAVQKRADPELWVLVMAIGIGRNRDGSLGTSTAGRVLSVGLRRGAQSSTPHFLIGKPSLDYSETGVLGYNC